MEGRPSSGRRCRPARRRRCRDRRAPGPCWPPASPAVPRPGRSPTACCRPAPSWCRGSRRRRRCGHRDARAGERVHRVAGRNPVTDIRRGVERVEQVHRVRAAGLEGDRDVASHRRRRHHQQLDGRRPSRVRVAVHNPWPDQPTSPAPAPAHTQPLNPSGPVRKVVNHISEAGRLEKVTAATPERIAAARPSSAYLKCSRVSYQRGRRGAQHPLDVGLHLLQLGTPVAPAVRAVGREVEHTVRAAAAMYFSWNVLLVRSVKPSRNFALNRLPALVPSRSDGLPYRSRPRSGFRWRPACRC